jgi:hypothetical protein
MAFGFKLGTSTGGAHRMRSPRRAERGSSPVAAVIPLTEARWEPLPPEVEDWMGMNPFTEDQSRTA